MRTSSEFRDLAAASAFSSLLFATGVLVPLLGPPAGFFSAAPLIWVAARHGPVAGLLGGMLSTAALLPLLPPPVALIFALEHALSAWYLGWIIQRGRSIVAGSALAALVVTVLVIGAALLLVGGGNDPVQLLEQQLRQGLIELGGSTTDGQSGAGGNPAALSASVEEVLAFLRRVLPAVTLIGIFLECSLNSLLAARVLARGGSLIKPWDLTSFKLPEWLVWALIASLTLCLTPQEAVTNAALNVLLPLLFGHLLLGLSITLHFAARARLSRFSLMLFASALVFLPWLLTVPLTLGLLEFRFGFRERWPIAPPPAAPPGPTPSP